MKTYRVRWEIDIDGDDVVDAAQRAHRVAGRGVQHPDTTANSYDVWVLDNPTRVHRVDLTERTVKIVHSLDKLNDALSEATRVFGGDYGWTLSGIFLRKCGYISFIYNSARQTIAMLVWPLSDDPLNGAVYVSRSQSLHFELSWSEFLATEPSEFCSLYNAFIYVRLNPK